MAAEAGTEAGAASAFLSRDFRLYQTARLLVILGAEAQTIAVAWQVYQITGSALDLGLTGLALFAAGPVLHAGGGARRGPVRPPRHHPDLLWLQAVCTFALLWFALHGIAQVWPIYAVLLGIGMGRAFSGPAASALLPSLVPKEHFVNAVTWGATVFQIANIAGPAVGGLLLYSPPDRERWRLGTARRWYTFLP